MCVQPSGKFGLPASCEGGNLELHWLRVQIRRREGLTATRYHLSPPSVLDGNFCSSFSNKTLASAAVGSSEELIMVVCCFLRIRSGVLELGLDESTGLCGCLNVFCRCLSICCWHLKKKGSRILMRAYVMEVILQD